MDASGKSTQADLLARFLQKKGKNVKVRTHPSADNIFGILTQRYLYQAGRKAHLVAAIFYILDVFRSLILYFYRNFDYLIYVRYLMGAAYLPTPFHIFAYYFFARLVPAPEVVFFIDVEPEIAFSRIKKNRKQFEMFESLKRLRKIETKASELRFIGNWVVIDGSQSMEAISKEVQSKIKIQ